MKILSSLAITFVILTAVSLGCGAEPLTRTHSKDNTNTKRPSHTRQQHYLAAAAIPSTAAAERLASALGAKSDLPENIRLRFQVLAAIISNLANHKENPSDTIAFFNTTRILFWNQPASNANTAAMQELEKQVAALARQRKVNLDTSKPGSNKHIAKAKSRSSQERKGVSRKSTSSAANPKPSSSLLTQKLSASQLLKLSQAARQEIAQKPADMIAIATLNLDDSLVDLNRELVKGGSSLPAPIVRQVLTERARLFSTSIVKRFNPKLKHSIDSLIQGLQASFEPMALRRAGDGPIAFP